MHGSYCINLFLTIYTAIDTGLIRCKSLPVKPGYCALAGKRAEKNTKRLSHTADEVKRQPFMLHCTFFAANMMLILV